MFSTKKLDTSDEFQIYRFGHGVKLIKPGDQNIQNSPFLHDTYHTVSSMLNLPLSVYFIRADSINEKVNESDAILCGFESVKDATGKTCFSKFTKKSAEITTKNDREVMRNQIVKISEEDVVLSEGNISRPTLSIKLPWYNEDNRVIGIFGCSIILGKHPLADSLSVVSKLGLLRPIENSSQYVGKEINKIYLSKRQLACANLLLLGLTQKEIALPLHLSPRTIESHIEILKQKLNCQNKTELILKLSEIIKNR